MFPNDNVIERMQTLIQAWQANGDRRSVFLSCYQMMTGNMLRAVDAGEFQDTTWVGILLHRFAGYYFDALAAYERHAITPTVWQIAHDATREPQTFVLQHLLLGVNAHINYDLVLTLVDLLHPEWPALTLEKREQRHSDYRHVNHVIGTTIDAVQDQILESVEPGLDVVDKIFGPMDEWLISKLITNWREAVWQNALTMLATPSPGAQEHFRQQLEAAAQRKAKAILLQGGPWGWREILDASSI